VTTVELMQATGSVDRCSRRRSRWQARTDLQGAISLPYAGALGNFSRRRSEPT